MGMMITTHPRSDRTPGYLLTRLRASDPQSAREISKRLEATAGAAVSEPGHISYEVFVVADDPTTFYVSETWASAEDATRHIELVQRTGAVEAIAPLLAESLHPLTLVPVIAS
ncbi:MAG: antibiotic biosynthesis monooxygenase [Solirubrobacterales bacterium]|nr:antibiotic biosynthesis monooxygenase [Solirubrobacterales bacterium]